MKLLKLSSDNPKFNEIVFQDGLNIVAGIQTSNIKTKTYNGIGKSFSLNLVHLMLGSELKKKTIKEKKTHEFLTKYGAFDLWFEHRDKIYHVKKDFANNIYHLNDIKLSVKEFKLELDRIFIPITAINQVSFRQAFNCFARRFGEKYYIDAHTQQGMPLTDFYQRFVNLWLLDFGTNLVIEKNNIKSELEKTSKARKALEDAKDKEHLDSVKDLKDLLVKLKTSKERFEIGPQYDELKNSADTLTLLLHEKRIFLSSLRSQIGKRKISAKRIKNVEIDSGDIKRIYEEANFFFPELVHVRFENAAKFHEKLTKSRLDRINSEVSNFEKEAEEIKKEISKIEKNRDEILSILNDLSAFEEYDSINEAIIVGNKQIENHEKFTKVIDELKTKESDLTVSNAEVNNLGRHYVNESKPKIEDIENKFRSIVKTFYAGQGGNLKIDMSKDAKYLFDLDIHIPRDASQGVNEVKIFCYDLLLHRLNPHLFNFLAHDGCIFSELDPRQKAMMFKNIISEINSSGLQYFINMGQSSIDEILTSEILDAEEKKIIKKSIRLELYDNNSSSWLFGEAFG